MKNLIRKMVLGCCAVMMAAEIGRAQTVTLTDIGSANPTPGPSDIYQLSTNGNTAAPTPGTGRPDGLNYYTDNSPPPGSTFTTPNQSSNLTLISVALRTGGLDSGGGYGTPGTTPYYYLRLYTVSGSTATLMQTFTNANPGFTDGHWLKWNNLSVTLAPNANYAFSFGRQPSPGGYCAMAVASGNPYAGGQIALIPTNGGTMTFGSPTAYDAVFDLGIQSSLPTANTPVVSPASTVYVGTTVSLTESALGSGTLFYQWQTDGGTGGSITNIPSATGTNISSTLTSSGTYKFDVIVSNSFGSETSSVLAVTVNPPETVTVQVGSPIVAMPLQGLGVCTAVYDNDLIDSAIAPKLLAAGIKALRTPGGSYADVYDWQNNTGIDGAYVNSSDSFLNFMNTDVLPVSGQAIVTVNYGSNPANTAGGDTNLAAAWVAYSKAQNYGTKYWEIGNEVGGNGYYGTNLDWEYDLHYEETNAALRVGQPALSPAAYGTNAIQFISAMKAQDPTILCGVGFDTGNSTYNSQLLGVCGSMVDFVIIHWYPGSDAPSLLASTATIGSTAQSCFTQLTNITGAAHASQMSICVTETGGGNVTGDPVSLFTADNYLTWIEDGAVNVDFQILHNDILTAANQPGHAYYGAQMAHFLARVGDTLLRTTSSQSLLRVHATARQDGSTGVMLINENPTVAIPATVTIRGTNLSGNGTIYQFGLANFIGTNDAPSYAVSSSSVSGLGTNFTVTVPAYTMIDVLVSPNPITPPVLAPISNQTVNVGQTVAFTASATDTNQPARTLTFSIVTGPTNATINTNSGAFSWRPQVTDAGTTNPITLEVADNGSPSLNAQQSFTVTVNPLAAPSLSSVGLNGGKVTLQIGGQAGPDYEVQVSTNLTNWIALFITNSPPVPFTWTDTNSATMPEQFYRVKIGPPLP
jgi:hypothetical protein